MELLLRQDNSCFGEGIPIQALPAVVAVGLVFPFHSPSALRADTETSKVMKEVKAADLHHRHGLAEGHLPPDRRRDQQVIGRQVKTNAEFFQGQDRWGGFASGNIAKISGTEVTLLGGGFITELAGITQSEDGRPGKACPRLVSCL